jgi:hypothetical protein
MDIVTVPLVRRRRGDQVRSRSLRLAAPSVARATLCGAGVVLSLVAAMLYGAAAASGAPTPASTITSPGNPSYVLIEPMPGEENPLAFTVEGTATDMSKVDIDCYNESGSQVDGPLASGVEVHGDGTFSVPVRDYALPYSEACTIRAVPYGDKSAHPSGPEDPFQGPGLADTRAFLLPSGGYEVFSYTFTGHFSFVFGGGCYQEFSGINGSESFFNCKAGLPEESPEYPGLTVDGSVAYLPYWAERLQTEELKAQLPGAPLATSSKSFDSATGLITLHDSDPIARCAPEASLEPTLSSCKEFVSTGVTLERTWQTASADRVALMTDTWRSTDGRAHELLASYGQGFNAAAKAGGAFLFPGATTFTTPTGTEQVTLPAGVGAIYYKEDSATPDAGDGDHLQGAIVYDAPPTGSAEINSSSDSNSVSMPYRISLPPGGSRTVRMAFVQTYALAEASTLVGEVLAGYPPSLAIAAPANGTTVATASVALSGTASDTGHLDSVAVDGQSASLDASGQWSANVPLSPGANTITAVATDDAGLTTSRSVTVDYSPPGSRPPASKGSAVARASRARTTGGKGDAVAITLTCKGAAGSSCAVDASLRTVEKTIASKLVAVSAAAGAKKHAKQRSRRVTVGTAKTTIEAGQKVTLEIPLNALGKRLLARFHRLPVRVTAVLVEGAKKTTILSQDLTVKSKPVKHRRRARR